LEFKGGKEYEKDFFSYNNCDLRNFTVFSIGIRVAKEGRFTEKAIGRCLQCGNKL
jgi:hypothetical protein